MLKREINPQWIKEYEELTLRNEKLLNNSKINESYESINKRCNVICERNHNRFYLDPNNEDMIYYCKTTGDFNIEWTLENSEYEIYHLSKSELLQKIEDDAKILRLKLLINIPRVSVN